MAKQTYTALSIAREAAARDGAGLGNFYQKLAEEWAEEHAQPLSEKVRNNTLDACIYIVRHSKSVEDAACALKALRAVKPGHYVSFAKFTA